MSIDLKFRPATSGDLPAIRDIHLANWRNGHKGIMPDAFLGAPLAAEMAGRWAVLPPAEDLLLVADSAGQVAGFALVRRHHPNGPLLESLHVGARFRGGGVGAALLGEVARSLAGDGYGALWLEVLDDNAGARRFYARMGGHEGPVFQDNLVGHTVPARRINWPSLGTLLRA